MSCLSSLRPTRSLLCRVALKKGVQIRRLAYSKNDIFRYLQVKEFSEVELQRSFRTLQGSDKVETGDNGLNLQGKVSVAKGLEAMHKQQVALLSNPEVKIKAFSALLTREKIPKDEITYEQYKKEIVSLGERLDRRVYVLGSSFLLTGVSVGEY